MENPRSIKKWWNQLLLVVTLFIAKSYCQQTQSTSSTPYPLSTTTRSPYLCPSYGLFGLCPIYSGSPCCSEFYSCSATGENGVLFSCSDGLVFSDRSNNPKCVPETSISEPGMCGLASTQSPSFTCPSEDANGFYPDPKCASGCCSQYYVCVQGKNFVANCSDGYIFDPISLNCVTIDRCTTWVIPTTPKPTSPPFTCPSETTNGFFADPSCSCCNTYYICNQGTSYPMICLNEGVFNEITLTCTSFEVQ